jgi:DNA ligase-associated metallophosphoesterase
VKGLAIEFGRAEVRLLPERAVWWEARRTLLVADVHLGKGAAFRAMGVPVPGGVSGRDLQRISELLCATEAQRLVILGDLLHARIRRHPEVVESISAWRERHAKLDMVLVRGNHDRASGIAPDSWHLNVYEGKWEEEGFAFVHEPVDARDLPTFAGHIHPKARLRDFDGSVVLAPCFVCDGNCMTLPSFGTFTGGSTVSEKEGRRIYVASTERIVMLRAE